MEHRHFSRKRVEIEADLYCGDQHMGCFGRRDLGRGGLFLNTGSTRLYPNTVVDVLLPSSEGAGGNSMQGLVIHCSSNGVGIMLTDYEPHAFRLVGELLDNFAGASGAEHEVHSHKGRQVA